MSFGKCPRCGYSTYERLKTYSHCVECLYFQDRYKDSESNLIEVEKSISKLLGENAEKLENKNSEISEIYQEQTIDLIGA